ncbi:surface-adhesin E family protein [Variovorax sp. HJSM1_2]|uniref:surface-adhesin E family protein n=1 Tax=Variovorax sp. HJSM1_2 TaxID=3366263 RepID=UPI003BD16E4A
MNLRKIVLVASLVWCGLISAQAQSPAAATSPATTPIWFTIMGDPDEPSVNTIQVDPVDIEGKPRTKRVRVSRSTQRTSWDGVPYRSYTSAVVFDCEKHKARYLQLTYYDQPNWQGEPSKTVDYSTGTPRWMEFRDVTPNPTQRILTAACTAAAKR